MEEKSEEPQPSAERLQVAESDVPPVAPPRRSPARRKRLLGKRVRKKTGGETGDGIKKLDPTTSEEENDNEKTVERKEDQWKREDEEKRLEKERKENEKRAKEEEEQLQIDEWAKIFQNAKLKQMELQSEIKDEPQIKKEEDKIIDEKPINEKTVDEKSVDEKTVNDKIVVDKTDNDKTVIERKVHGKIIDKKPEEQSNNEIITEDNEHKIPWWKFWKRLKAKEEPKEPKHEKKIDIIEKVEVVTPTREETKTILRLFTKEARKEYIEFKRSNSEEWEKIKRLSNKCIGELLLIIMLCGVGAFTFRFTEGAFENFYKCGVKRVKRDFVEELWKTSTYLKEDEWKSKARRKLMEFEEQLGVAFDAGVSSYSGHKSWSFMNALVYSLTVITTIGYGHIAPATTTGKALTIVYATIGIPLFLILLADFGKLFTRGIKWVWAFVRRLYYTGSCKKVRKTARVQEVMKGVQLVYDIAAFRRPSSSPVPPGTEIPTNKSQEPDTIPSTPAPSNFVIDEEFNLPISLAIIILVLYIFCGAVVFFMWEDWSFFDSFYFVFISMSTIGFGDFVPKNKMYMMASIVYLAFGLALTSMCINVVQEKLSDTFRQASSKIGATIGLKMKEVGTDDLSPNTPAPVELAQIHQSSNKGTTPSLAAV